MKKAIYLILLVLMTISCNKAVKSQAAESTEKKDDIVEVLYFHGAQRCVTCNAIERETKQLIDSVFAQQLQNDQLTFKVIDISDKANQALADKYEVTWSTLLINNWKDGKETVNNLTEFAFGNARHNPNVFKTELQRIINDNLNN